MDWILASSSPRRQQLLALLREQFEVLPADCDERFADGTPPEQAVALLAERKATAVAAARPDALVIGSDTVVALGQSIFGKPRDAAHAAQMLRALRGQAHTVHTGVCVICPGEPPRTAVESTRVRFAPMSEREIDFYVRSGEPMGKAGAYGIQGLGARFVSGIEGDYYTVMGLPVHRLYRLLTECGALPQDGAGL